MPLIALTFNLFQVSPEERATTTAERTGSLKSEMASISLSIENELAEINVLEPQLAESKNEEAAYVDGLKSREQRKLDLEQELEVAQFELFNLEKKQKEMNEEVVAMRDKLVRVSDITSEPTSRRSVQSTDIPKLISFFSADGRRLKETEKEKAQLNIQLLEAKQRLLETSKKIRETTSSGLLANIDKGSLVRSSIKNVNIWTNGFVPIDSIGHKRRREEEREKEIENRKPVLSSADTARDPSHRSTTADLQLLVSVVSLLSDGEDDDAKLGENTHEPTYMDTQEPHLPRSPSTSMPMVPYEDIIELD